ncbi:hypothetical protein HYALB_00004360 [Hymenoscyphus albidus]|uniref:Uncharacterized protein n=1 Tax=Hymenoscyphus albidus TaxID=595503 RepID=A0A9N9Q482_9HELO|nr:hypothetical protein HYALB_00004360 [Hymenoscyphus albidus]
MLLDITFRRVLGRWKSSPLLDLSFDNQNVLITGGTAGLGLAAAVHFASQGARVFITGRTETRGRAAKQHIEQAARVDGKDRVVFMLLDMGTYTSCMLFVDELKDRLATCGGLDVAVLSAGNINSRFEKSPEGWEQTIQVNTLSTTLLGLLLLAWMKSERPRREYPAHLVFVTSRDHLYPNIKNWPTWAEQGGILSHLNSKENWPDLWKTTLPNYANCKLLVMYAIAELSKQALDLNSEPQVIVRSVCPGIVKTDIGRSVQSRSMLLKIVGQVYFKILGKSPDHGAREFVRAALSSKNEHGKFSMTWLSSEGYRKKAIPNMTSQAGRKVQAIVWSEIIAELTAKVPSLHHDEVTQRGENVQ